MRQNRHRTFFFRKPADRAFLPILLALLALGQGCALTPNRITIEGTSQSYPAGTILAAGTQKPVAFAELISRLGRVQVVYAGEEHTNPADHAMQLKVIMALQKIHPRLIIGMEMFDHTYQKILDEWSAGLLSLDDFLEKTHWYANWRYDHRLYEEILEFIKEKKLRLIGLNLPPCIPPKIRVGGIQNLSLADKAQLPATIDLSRADHKAYVKRIYAQHHAGLKYKFEYFYQAQCVWEDAMAEGIARHLNDQVMVVLTGKGHIVEKFGVPKRAYRRTRALFRTIYPVSVGRTVKWSVGDYLWVTP